MSEQNKGLERRLRNLALPDPYDERPVMNADLFNEAAQEIESLRAEVQTLREYNKKVRKAAYDYLKSWEKVDLADVDATATIGTEAALNNALLSTQEQEKGDE